MGKFWEHYAKTNDSIRTELIDKAWFQEKTGSAHFYDHVKSQENQEQPEQEGYDGIENNNVHQSNGLNGIGHMGDKHSNWDTVKQAAHNNNPEAKESPFYPNAQEAVNQPQERFEGLYGQDAQKIEPPTPQEQKPDQEPEQEL